MGTLYLDTGGSATNSGSSDQNAANLSGAAATVSGSTVTLDGSPNLSGLVTSGANQSSIFLADATNTNKKIFWITAFDNTAKTVDVDTAPTGITSSTWAIGGRQLTAALACDVLRAGDELIINNSPAAHSGSAMMTVRTSGTTAAGFIKIRGKTGVRPNLHVTDTNNVINCNNQNLVWIENLEFDQDGASGAAINNAGMGTVIFNNKVIDAGGNGITINANAIGVKIIGNDVAACGVNAIGAQNGQALIFGNVLRDCGSTAITSNATSSTLAIICNLIYGNAGHGIDFNGGPSNAGNLPIILFNTIYANLGDGLRFGDADYAPVVLGNILKDNGNAGTEYNLNFVAGLMERTSLHAWNIINQTGGTALNLNNASLNQLAGTEFSTDPLFTNVGGDDFSIGASSPGKAAAFPGAFLDGINIGFLDIGAVQRQEAGGGGGDTGGLTRLNAGLN